VFRLSEGAGSQVGHGAGCVRGEGSSTFWSRSETVRYGVVSHGGGVGRAEPLRARCDIYSFNRLSYAGKDDVRAALKRVSDLRL
jgi:hypothetical protein